MAVKEPDGYHGKIHETMWSVWPTWPSWTWPGWEGKSVEVEVYTKAPEVKLYLNDKLIDTKKVSRETQYKAVFSLPYEAGTLRAEAGGKSVSLATAGKPARLKLTTDKKVIAANGQSLAYITVEVVDKEGRLCPEAAIPCEAVVKGQGQLMAFASADMKDREPYTSPKVTTWKGRAMLVVRSGKAAGKTQVTIKSSLTAASLTLRMQ
jgi:beta-galactosidase